MSRLSPWFLFAGMILLPACGGGGGGSSPSPGPQPTPAFTLSVVPPEPIQAGRTGTLRVSAVRSGGHAAAIQLSIATNAPGITGTGDMASGASTAEFALQVPSTTPAQPHELSLRGWDGNLARTATFQLSVDAAPAPDFTLALDPAALVLAPGTSATIILRVERTGGFSDPVDVALEGAPVGVTGSARILETSAPLAIQVGAAVAPGTYTFQVRGVAGALARAASFRLEVTTTQPPVGEPAYRVPAPDGTFAGLAPVTTGVPMGRGVMTNPDQWRVETYAGTPIAAQLDVAARWSDGSVRWVHASHYADVAPGGGTRYRLARTAPAAVSNPLQVTDGPTQLTVNTQAVTCTYAKHQLALGSLPFTLRTGGATFTAVPNPTEGASVWPAVDQPWQIEVQGPMKAVVRIEGDWRDAASASLDTLVRWRARLTFWRGSGRIRCEFTLRNGRNWDTPNDEPVNHAFHALPIQALRWGTQELLPADASLGAAADKTFDLELEGGVLSERFLDWDPAAPYPRVPPRPVGFPDPAYLESTGAFGPFAAPLAGGSGEIQEALDRSEKLMRAMAVLADVETPVCARPGAGTAVEHLALDRGSWMNYGCLRWAANGCSQIYSRNHYDHVLGLYLNALRSGRVELLALGQIMARHELDLDQYHTAAHNAYYDFMRNWEEGDHRSPGNCFGLGRPTHTWNRGYLVHFLWCGERRGLDVLQELVHGTQRYLYEGQSLPWLEREIRFQGWMSEIFFSRHLLDPVTPIETALGPRTPAQAMADVLEGIVLLEEGDGRNGYIREPDGGGAPTGRVHTLQMRYVLEPMINAYEFALKGSGHLLETRLRACIERMIRWLRARAEGGTSAGGLYTPLRWWTHWNLAGAGEGDPEYSWNQDMASLVGWLWLQTGEDDLLRFMRQAFRDFAFYRDGPAEPSSRVATRYGSCTYWDTESKLNGWFLRGGQWFLKAEQEARRQGR